MRPRDGYDRDGHPGVDLRSRRSADRAAACPRPPGQARPRRAASTTSTRPADAEPEPRRRLRDRLGRSRAPFAGMRGRMRARRIDDEAWDDLEETLLAADTGLETTTALVDAVRRRAVAGGVTRRGRPPRAPRAGDRRVARCHPSGPDAAPRTGSDERRGSSSASTAPARPRPPRSSPRRRSPTGTRCCSRPRTRSGPPRPTSSRCGATGSAST